jgi:secreted trypsin-like serine protease
MRRHCCFSSCAASDARKSLSEEDMRMNRSIQSARTNTTNTVAHRRSLRLPLAALAMTAACFSVSALAQQRDGNWMREYVTLRVADKNMQYAPLTLTLSELDRMVSPRIVGGSVAGAGDNPFQVALLTKNIANNFDAQFCGGTLVKPNVVVTAAHCSDFVSAGQVQVLTGTRNLDGSGTRRNVTRITIHPNWNPGTFNADVAVWQLSSSANGIPLATLASTDGAVGTNLLVTGWGALSEGGSFPINLRKVLVPLASRTNCNDANSYNGDITGNMLCAGRDSGGIDSCQGDSGGPLTRGSALTGIVSWGTGCARRNLFGVYTRVSSPTIRNFIINTAGL